MPSPTLSSAMKTIYTLLLMLALSCAAQGQTFTVLHRFDGKNGASPEGVLVLDAAGNIYGTTGGGGTGTCSSQGCGTGFMLNKAGKQLGVYSFDGADGLNPYAGLLRDKNGNFYGTTLNGGDESCDPPNGCGTVFKVSKTGKETVLHKFTGRPDGEGPESVLVEDPVGNLYGTTYLGGSDGLGAIFKIATNGKETILYSFLGPPEGGDGAFSYTGVIRDGEGNLYGVTAYGGAFGAGAVYELNAAGEETLLFSFSGGPEGSNPDSVLLLDSQGNLYGTTADGGTECGGTGCGVVFELSPQQGGSWSEKTLYQFCSISACADGEQPGVGPLIIDSAGNIYGTTYFGGDDGDGVVFELSATGEESVLHSFSGKSDGANPVAGLAKDGSGSLYGTAEDGGEACYVSYTCGVVFRVVP